MLHPIFSVLIRRPELVLDHIAGYATLVREEASGAGGHVTRRLLAWGVAAASFIIGGVLAGVALMLGAMRADFHWILLVVPALPLLLTVLAVSMARKPLPETAFAQLRSQLDTDAQALRMLGARS